MTIFLTRERHIEDDMEMKYFFSNRFMDEKEEDEKSELMKKLEA